MIGLCIHRIIHGYYPVLCGMDNFTVLLWIASMPSIVTFRSMMIHIRTRFSNPFIKIFAIYLCFRVLLQRFYLRGDNLNAVHGISAAIISGNFLFSYCGRFWLVHRFCWSCCYQLLRNSMLPFNNITRFCIFFFLIEAFLIIPGRRQIVPVIILAVMLNEKV